MLGFDHFTTAFQFYFKKRERERERERGTEKETIGEKIRKEYDK